MSDKDSVINERLEKMEKKLDSIESKLSSKWFLPVFTAILTSLLALISFFVQRSFTLSDTNQRKQSEIIGQFIADSKINFYKECKIHLTSINEQFESLCVIGLSKQVASHLDSSLINFRKFIVNQQVIDQDVVEPVKRYAEFVSESAFDISSRKVDIAEISQYYQKSLLLFEESRKALDTGIKQISSQ